MPPGNSAQQITIIQVPAGSTGVYVGQVAGQGQWGEDGGGAQVVIPVGNVDPSWVVGTYEVAPTGGAVLPP